MNRTKQEKAPQTEEYVRKNSAWGRGKPREEDDALRQKSTKALGAQDALHPLTQH